MAFIRLVLAHDQNLFQYQLVKKNYEGSCSEIEKTLSATQSFVEEVAIKIRGLQGPSFDQSLEISGRIETQLYSLNRFRKEIDDLSGFLRTTQRNFDSYLDPMLQKITEKFPEFFEQLEKINGFAKQHFSTSSTEEINTNAKVEIRKMLNNVENLSRRLEEVCFKMAELSNQNNAITEKSRRNSGQFSLPQSSLNEQYCATPLGALSQITFCTPDPSPGPSPRNPHAVSRIKSRELEYPFNPFVDGVSLPCSSSSSMSPFSVVPFSTRASYLYSSRRPSMELGVSSRRSSTEIVASSRRSSTEIGMSSRRSSTEISVSSRRSSIEEINDRINEETRPTPLEIPEWASLRNGILPKSHSDSLINYDLQYSFVSGDSNNDVDWYDNPELAVPKPLSNEQSDKKRHRLSNIKSKSYDTALSLAGTGYKYLTGNTRYEEFFGSEPSQNNMLIHMDTIIASAQLFSSPSPKDLSYHAFKSRLENNRVRAEIVVKQIEKETEAFLQMMVKEGITLREHLKTLVVSLETIAQYALRAITSNENQSKWGTAVRELMENCYGISLIANQIKNYVEQGEAIWIHINAISQLAKNPSINVEDSRVQLKKSYDNAHKILNILQQGNPIYLENIFIDKIVLMHKIRGVINELNSIARSRTEPESSQECLQLQEIVGQLLMHVHKIDHQMARWMSEIDRGSYNQFPQAVTFIITEYLGMN